MQNFTAGAAESRGARCGDHRRRPQRLGVRRLSRGGGPQSHGARAASGRRRRRRDRGVPPRLPQFGGRLYRLAAQPEDHPRPRPAAPRFARGRAAIGELPAAERQPISESRRGKNRAGSGEVLGARCRAPLGVWYPARSDRRRAARSRARNSAERHRRDLAGGFARTAARRSPGQTNCKARHDAAARAARAVRQVGGRLSRLVVRERSDQGGVRLRRHRGQLRESLLGGLRLRAAAPRVRRGQRQEGSVGPRDRRHGRDHASDGQVRGRARRRGSHCHSRERSDRRGRPRGRRGHRERRGCSRALRRLERESKAPVRELDRRLGAGAGLSRAHTPLAVRIGDVPHERRALGVARLHRTCRGAP